MSGLRRPVRSVWIPVGRTRFHARTSAVRPPPGTPVIVLVHGLGVSSRYMTPLLRALAGHCRVYAVDLPGFGRTPGPRDALPLAALADALAAWLDAMDIHRPMLLGNSMGCQILAEFAVRHPSRAERLALVGPTIDRHARSAWQQAWRLLLDTLRETPSLPLLVAFDYAVFGPRRFRQTFRDAVEDRIEEKLPKIAVPVMIVRGAMDPFAPEPWVNALAALLPNGRCATVPGAAHAVHYSAPAALADLLRRFLQDPPYAGDVAV